MPIAEDASEEMGRTRHLRLLPASHASIAATAGVHAWSVVIRNVKGTPA